MYSVVLFTYLSNVRQRRSEQSIKEYLKNSLFLLMDSLLLAEMLLLKLIAHNILINFLGHIAAA